MVTVPAPPLAEYVPRAGDQWLVAVLRQVGVSVSVSGPAGWTQMDTICRVADPVVPVRVGDVTFWLRVLRDGDDSGPVVFFLERSVWARTVLRVYRPGWRRRPGDPVDVLGEVGAWPAD